MTSRNAAPQGVTAAAATDVGQKREHNEDRVLVRNDLRLYVVADGAGGHNAGDVASALAVKSIANYFEATEPEVATLPTIDKFGLPRSARRLSAAIHKANRDVVEISKKNNRFKGMGTTIVAVRLSEDGRLLHLAHVGDSRCYRLRAGYLDQITEDHSLINDVLEERPEIDEAVMAKLPRHVVTRALGMADKVRVTVRSVVIAPGDRYLLCTDGLSGPLGNAAIAEGLSADRTAEELVQGFIASANEAGGPDNIGVVVVTCDDVHQSDEEAQATVHMTPPSRRSPHATSDPEIILLGIEEVSLEPEVTMVPSRSADDALVNVLQDLVRPIVGPKR